MSYLDGTTGDLKKGNALDEWKKLITAAINYHQAAEIKKSQGDERGAQAMRRKGIEYDKKAEIELRETYKADFIDSKIAEGFTLEHAVKLYVLNRAEHALREKAKKGEQYIAREKKEGKKIKFLNRLSEINNRINTVLQMRKAIHGKR